ncbi:hypothetical protein B0H10DRAFT_2053070 [Mycena sp. CBHHK59/15]|nr:hypothetical protein B0H10DRAFT_2053070 [Mycena sp. CBHHK59/15]
MSLTKSGLRPGATTSHVPCQESDVEDGEIVESPTLNAKPGTLSPAVSLLSSTSHLQVRDYNNSLSRPPSSVTSLSPSSSHVASCVEYTMSPEELDSAKSIVLDLLGWGVEPEYLVECGVSAAVIYRIFTDLRLRLPRNLPVEHVY